MPFFNRDQEFRQVERQTLWTTSHEIQTGTAMLGSVVMMANAGVKCRQHPEQHSFFMETGEGNPELPIPAKCMSRDLAWKEWCEQRSDRNQIVGQLVTLSEGNIAKIFNAHDEDSLCARVTSVEPLDWSLCSRGSVPR